MGLYVLGGAITACVFSIDLSLELGAAGGVFYVGVIAFTALIPSRRSTFGFAIAATVLTLVGYFWSPAGGEIWKVIVNRLVAVFAVWATAALVIHQKYLTAVRAREAEQYRQAVASNPNAMVISDRQGLMVLVNAEAESLLGYDPGELLGRSVHILVPERSRERQPIQCEGFMLDPRPRRLRRGRELFAVRKDGREVPVEIGLAKIETADGVFVLSTLMDLTDRKRVEAEQRSREVALQLEAAVEAQRGRIAREIHDVLGQALTALKRDIAWLSERFSDADESLRLRASAMDQLATSTIDAVRRLAAEIRPVILDDHGLVEALRWQVGDFEERTGIRCTLALPAAEPAWPGEQCTAAYRILQECLTNVMRHAQAEKVSVALWERDGEAVLQVCDDGRGISADAASASDSIGIGGMRERARLHDGTVTITGGPAAGTTVTLRMPLGPADPGEDPAAGGEEA
jgi:PAS domain S-box-containing protein